MSHARHSPSPKPQAPSPLWCEVRLAVPLDQVEPAADALVAVAPGGVSIEEPVVPLGPEEGVRLERDRPAIVTGYLPVDDGLGARLDRLRTLLSDAGIDAPLETRRRAEEEWADAWKEHFHVERIGRRLVIRPSWREHTPLPGEVVIDLDPGMAFGTGQHPTTRACLALLEVALRPGMRVLDLGCGSGILAVAAAKLGAAAVLAIDIDPQAVRVTVENAARNGVAHAIVPGRGSLGDAWPFPDDRPAEFDLILANIHARALRELAPALAAALRPDGALVASGLIAEHEAGVREAFAREGLAVGETVEGGEWRSLLLRR